MIALALLASASAFVPGTRTRMMRSVPKMSTEAEERVVTPLPASVKPGVVTGQALTDLLNHAVENKCVGSRARGCLKRDTSLSCVQADKEE